MATFTESGLEVYPISVEHYDEMVRHGILGEDDKVELLRGVITTVSPPGDPHIMTVDLLTAAFGSRVDWTRFTVRVQQPVRLPSLGSVPEPDVSLVTAPPRTALKEIPALVIEVADSSLRRDLQIKAEIYAEAGIPEYWVIDLPNRTVHVHRDPSDGRYLNVKHHTSGELAPLTDGIPPIDIDALLTAVD